MAVPTNPQWLTVRDGSLKPGISERILFVMLGGQPQYRLDLRPAGGQFACAVTQTVNGKRFDAATNFPTADAAFAGGLEALRNQLGW